MDPRLRGDDESECEDDKRKSRMTFRQAQGKQGRKHMKFRNISTKTIYLKHYRREDAGQIAIGGLLSLLEYTLKIVFFTLLPIALVTLVTSKLPVFGLQSFVVLSGSMEPTLPVGSIVYTLKDTTYMIKDVISYKATSDRTVTHRIVDKLLKPEGIVYQVKGDVNEEADIELIPESQVLGKAVTLIPFLGYAVVFLKTLPGLIAFIIAPALIFIGFELWSIKKEFEKEVERKITSRIGIQQ